MLGTPETWHALMTTLTAVTNRVPVQYPMWTPGLTGHSGFILGGCTLSLATTALTCANSTGGVSALARRRRADDAFSGSAPPSCLGAMSQALPTVVGVDWVNRTDRGRAARGATRVAHQGTTTLDLAGVLLAGFRWLQRAVGCPSSQDACSLSTAGAAAHVLNLGHGCCPTPIRRLIT